MSRYVKPPFQFDKPLFCKVPFQHRGQTYEAGQQFKWQNMGLEATRLIILYNQGDFYHSDELEEELEPTVGDGLDELNLENLHKLKDKINDKVKALANDKVKPCRQSNIKFKQIAYIRNWRSEYGEHE